MGQKDKTTVAVYVKIPFRDTDEKTAFYDYLDRRYQSAGKAVLQLIREALKNERNFVKN